MVVPIRELANTLFSTPFTTPQPFPMASLPSNMDMDIDIDIIRGRSVFSSRISSRESSTHLNASTSPYHKQMEMQNNLLDEDVHKPVNSSQLSYTLNNEQVSNSVRKAADNGLQEGAQHV